MSSDPFFRSNISWTDGTSLWPGIKNWPGFSSGQKPPGTQLVTMDLYSVLPGIILYDFVPTTKAIQLAATAVTSITVAAAITGATLWASPYIASGAGAFADLGASFGTAILDSVLAGGAI